MSTHTTTTAAAAQPATPGRYTFGPQVDGVFRLEGDTDLACLNRTAGQLASLLALIADDGFGDFQCLADEQRDGLLGLAHDLARSVCKLSADVTASQPAGDS